MFATYAVLLGRVFPSNEQGYALGTSAAIAAFFLAAGPFIGGVLAEYLSWRVIFWMNVPISFFVWRAVLRAIPADNAVELTVDQHFDYMGFFTFLFGFGTLVITLMQSQIWGWNSPYTIYGALLAIVLLIVFVVTELTVRQPLVDLRLFKKLDYLCANVVLLTAQVSVMVIAFWAIWLQVSMSYTPLEAGLRLLPTGLPIIYMGRFAGKWADSSGVGAPIKLGCGLCLLSAIWMSVTIPMNNYALSLVGMLLYGVGAPLVISPGIKAVLIAVPGHMAGMASGTLNTMRNLGAALCFAVVGTAVSAAQRFYFNASNDLSANYANLLPQMDSSFLLKMATTPGMDNSEMVMLRSAAANGYAYALGWGMWTVVAFAAVGFFFACIGFPRSSLHEKLGG
ncbi:MFS family permease [Glaciimonas immobilis]|uniref:MFS family permease n=3 Tax=Glaciimonas immobilis TaxID=728004 RepID=A0A840RX65_9BURK|nr:MFS transporter [Glaciimonas immobilis]KAF3996405.1 MFS transporter [Glaciimonas immobilis]MBB5201264.1 MFS family permease [Glaciimonas immobilis]